MHPQLAEHHRLDRRGEAAAAQQRHGLCSRAAEPEARAGPIVAYPGESDKGPYPVPENVPIEGWPVELPGQEGHARPTCSATSSAKRATATPWSSIPQRVLYEFYQMQRTDAGWQAAQASVFDLKSNKLRPDGWTSTDAAGLPIFPAVVRYDELQRGMVGHAMRVTVRRTRRAYVAPATHFASRLNDPNLPRMGERIRLRADYPIERLFAHPRRRSSRG